ncbi:MAG: ribosome small subunit-dependent GTPase A [Defluviitaleaceae bacterium]|nr:ribosome small subunit-dependent GTPase A [Defluviitaleaceae bacterium]
MARISGVFKSGYKAIIDGNEIDCKLGKFVKVERGQLPAIGDFVEIDENGYISHMLPRKSVISRKVAGKKQEEQVIAANVDYAFIVTSANSEFNLRRIERYLALLDISGVDSRLVLTKADLCDDISEYQAKARELGIDEDVIITSSATGQGLDGLKNLLTEGKTAVFMGSSGVGKSSLINVLVGDYAQKVSGISQSHGKGRHTTTHREMFMLGNGAFIIDTPGMREIQFFSGTDDLTTFADIDQLAQNCKFRNCSHKTEPNCAVKAAIENGDLSAERLRSYEKLKRETNRK